MVWLSEGQLGLDYRVGEDVNPEVFFFCHPLSQCNLAEWRKIQRNASLCISLFGLCKASG